MPEKKRNEIFQNVASAVIIGFVIVIGLSLMAVILGFLVGGAVNVWGWTIKQIEEWLT